MKRLLISWTAIYHLYLSWQPWWQLELIANHTTDLIGGPIPCKQNVDLTQSSLLVSSLSGSASNKNQEPDPHQSDILDPKPDPDQFSDDIYPQLTSGV
jgi:hypothetical protein